ncbi:MAG: mannonate dehydratase [Tannerellaceae bacterium]|jgi:mannonate dehydratase|nr:mannonate dehydratase [Tannerellaceae bacterium]
MKKVWRWFGPSDPIPLAMLPGIGVQGIATSLYRTPIGAVWQTEDILSLKQYIESFGLTWQVAETLPVHESIKYNGERAPRMTDYFQQSLANLSQAGIRTVCYHFTPLIESIRTDFRFPLTNGEHTFNFDPVRFAYFDIRILHRPRAQDNYTQDCLAAVEDLSRIITPEEERQLVQAILSEPRDFEYTALVKGNSTPVNHFHKLLNRYQHTGREQLRNNLTHFLQQLVPFAERYGVKLALHPDDPPLPLFGLPRVASSVDDLGYLLQAVDNYYNGLTFCAGSLASGLHNDVEALSHRFVERTHFLHLHAVEQYADGSFSETPRLDGYPDCSKLIRLFETKSPLIPYRIDHYPHTFHPMDISALHSPVNTFAQIDKIITAINPS